MKPLKKLSLYILISIIMALFICTIFLKVDSGYFEVLHTALTHSQDEIITQSKTDIDALVNDTETLSSFQESYEYYYSKIPENVQDKEGYLLAELSTVYLPTIKVLSLKYELQCYLQALIIGLSLGIIIYLIINLNFKFSLLKLLLGALTFIIITFLIGGFIIGFKNVIHFHLLKYIVWSIVSYIAILLINLAAQKNRIHKLNKNLNNDSNK